MNLSFAGQEDIAAPRESVWRRLLDPEAVARAAPGVEAIRVVDSAHWEVDVQAGIGPVSVGIRLAARLHDLEPPQAARMDLDGTGAGSHILLATRLRLEAPAPGRTLLHWEADAGVEGSLARLGRGIVELAARAFTHDFWRRFAEQAAAAVLPEAGAGAQIPKAVPAAPHPPPERPAVQIPGLILRKLYTYGSLTQEPDGLCFSLKNRLSDATFLGLAAVHVNGVSVPLDDLTVELGSSGAVPAEAVSRASPRPFPLREVARVRARGFRLEPGTHDLRIEVDTEPFGRLDVRVQDAVQAPAPPARRGIPYDKDDNYSPGMVRARQAHVEERTGVRLEHLTHYSFDPTVTQGNVENFTGVAQVPIGVAGPLRVNGEHAQGEFLIPLATTEGTLVASYSRGMKVLNLSGGVTATISDDCMQRAPVFIFDSAREARAFRQWVFDHMDDIRREAEATSSVARLLYVDPFLASKFAYLRFNYSTGDAAGQNMVGRATYAACSWILEHAQGVRRFYLESNLATDKKASQVNVMRTRGKRVTAEAVIPRDVLVTHMRVEPESLVYHAGVANVGSILSGANNNGLHSPNGITAMFIATGQDVANVAEGSAAIVYTELTREGALYLSITIPSLIVATHGGGTGLPTQRECLELLGCVGKGKVGKFAEIVAGVVLAGELSLAAAISSLEWVSSHEQYGRNR